MSKLTQTPPLITLNRFPLVPVQVHLSEPFLPQQGSRKTRIALELFALFGRLELILTKKESLEDVSMIDDLSKAMLKKLSKERDALNAQIDTTWAQLDVKETLYRQTMMFDMKLRELFPHATSDMDSMTLGPIVDRSISEHYQQVALYDQLYSFATHSYYSLSLDDHTYIPHDLSMIYPCLAQLDGSFIDYRAKIQNFESIMSDIADQKQKNKDIPPTLTKKQNAELEKLLKEMIEQVLCGTETSQPIWTRQYRILSEAILGAQKHTCA